MPVSSFPGGAEPANNENKLAEPVAQLPRRAGGQHLPANETQIERSDVNQLPLQNIFAASKIDSSHTASFVAMRERPLEQFAAFLQQPFSVIALDPATC